MTPVRRGLPALALLVAAGAVTETRTGRQDLVRAPPVLAFAAQVVPADQPALTMDAAKALKNPVANTSTSIGRGRRLYGSLGCATCHGSDGKALVEIVANATDLTSPAVYRNGTDEGLLYRSLRDGAGLAMPPFKTEVDDQQELWHLVNFIRSLWPEGQRPPQVAQKG
jgi:mono/diheme cytochrome c family protein